MTERLADVEARIATVHKLAAVISAMRGIAALRAQEAQRHVDSIRVFAETIGAGISQALAFLPDTDRALPGAGAAGRRAVILLAAEQGFAGTYSEAVFDAAADIMKAPHDLFLAGDRGLLVAEDRNLKVVWSAPMIAHPVQAAALATRLTDAVFADLAEGRVSEVFVVHQAPASGGETLADVKQLVPFDYARFAPPQHDVAPLITLTPETLLSRLVEEYVFAELSEAILLSFAAENEARTRAMMAAHDNVSNTLSELLASSRRLRQSEITEEIVELATGSLPAR